MPNPAVVSNPPLKSRGRRTGSDYDSRVFRQFLRENAVDESHITGSWFELCGYVRGSLS